MVTARKRFGQHFLQDDSVIAKIIQYASPQAQEHWVEIGPGLGALTMPLLKKIHHLEAIELDKDLIGILQEKAKPLGELIIHQGDVLQFDFHALQNHEQRLHVIGNLPYNISTPIIFHLLNQLDAIKDMHFMLQQEVIDRMAAVPNSKAYGRLSVMIQYYCEVEDLFVIPPSAFSPPPKVYSKFVRLTPYQQKPFIAHDETLLATIVREAFNHRRKTIRNSLKSYFSDVAFEKLQISPLARAENLSVANYVQLANFLRQ